MPFIFQKPHELARQVSDKYEKYIDLLQPDVNNPQPIRFNINEKTVKRIRTNTVLFSQYTLLYTEINLCPISFCFLFDTMWDYQIKKSNI